MAHSEGRHSPLEKTKLEHLFETVAALVRKTTKEESSSSDEEIANEIKLKLYGLYKHATEGECRGDNWPSVLQAVARSKYQAWEACKLYTRANAMKEYVQILATRNDKIGRQCQELLEEFQRGVQEHCNELDTRPDVSQNQKTPAGPRSEFSELENTGDEKKSSFLYSWIVYLFGLARIRPLIPRGLLDISFSDLAYALYHCLRWRFSVERCIQLNDQICQVWKEATGHDSVVGLSVRSLFDTYLCSKNYSDQSEVIVFPPISVPGMMHVAKFHNLRIVPVDIEEIDWWNSKGIQESINERTVAIMLVHPFGMLAVSDSQLIELRQLADKHRLELWEDCAECFTGLGKDCYLGSPVSDLRFFSFGMIKTATALGGGVAIFRDAKVAKQIQRSQLLLHKRQTALAFLRRILLSAILNFVGSSPLRVGLLAALCSACGLNFDKVITSAVRGFQVANPPKNEDKRDRLIQSHLVRQIRQQPSQCLLALLFRRFQQSLEMAPSVADRLKRCQHMNEMLRSISPDILISNKPNVFHTYWSFPISCHDRDTVSQYLHRLGFDVVSGASQLCCVSSCTNEQYQCPRTKDLMNSILYLPIASQHLSDKDIFRLADALRYEARGDEHLLFDAVGHNCNFRDETTKQWPQMIGIFVFFLSSTGVFVGLAPMLQSLVWMIVTAFGLWSLYIFLSLLLLHILRYMTAEFYLNKSTSFSENCDMVDAATFEGPIDASMAINTRNKVLSQIDALKIPTRVLENESAVGSKVILTGATGFVGSLLLRELLFYRERLSVSGVIVLCRRKRRDSASTRISRLLAKPMFSFLSETEKKELVDVVEGDVTKSFAGLCEADISRIFQDASISYVIHSAASVSFTQDLPEAARSNITSSLNMQSFASELKNKNAQFVHISTAFVHGDLCGSESFPLQEALFPLGPFEAGQIYKSMLGTQFYATKAMSELRFHNTYTFSKCVCEHLLMQKNDNNTMIIRPSIVGPAVETPFEGWAGEKPSTIVAGACLHLSHQWNIWYLEPRPVAYIPVDVLAHFVLSKLFEERQNSPSSDAASSSDSSFEQIGRISDTSSDYDEASTSTNSTNKNEYQRHRILNATWDTASNNHAVFSWLEFSVAYLHLGCVLGYFKRTTAYLSLLAGAQVMPTLVPSNYFYDQVHSIFIRAPMQAVMSLCGLIGYSTEGFTELFSFLDLPLLFFPFVKNSFCFQSDLVAPKCFDPKRYVFSCGVAAHRFLSATRTKTNENISSSCRRAIPGDQPSLSTVMVGGRACHVGSSDFWWAFSQPKGGYLIRFMAFLFIKILRAVCSVVTVDVTSFRGVLSSIKSQQSRRVFLVLAPTHRSFFDFILLSYVFFALPELQIDIPFIVAADDFERLPVIGWLARLLQAFYVHRGRGYEDPRLTTSLTLMKERNLTTDGACLEVFLEGTRSRDRRFVEPKTGFLKSLKQSGGEHMFIPITINYETLPEQSFMSDEASGTYRGGLRLSGMIGWLKNALLGQVNIGKIHIVGGEPLAMTCECNDDFKSFAKEIQMRQQDMICVSEYHINAASKLLNVDPVDTEKALIQFGCKFWPQTSEYRNYNSPQLPVSKSELCTILLQFGHKLAPLFYAQHRQWSIWLDRDIESRAKSRTFAIDNNTQPIFEALLRYFTEADFVVSEALQVLKEKGFHQPKSSHVFQVAKNMNCQAPFSLVYASVMMKLLHEQSERLHQTISTEIPDVKLSDTHEKLGFWGFDDSGFIVRTSQQGRRTVTMKGSRYNLCGKSLTKLLPFIESEMHVQFNPLVEFEEASIVWCRPRASKLDAFDQNLLRQSFSRVSFETLDRIRHGTGHSQEDVYHIRCGDLMRIPDAVVWPPSEAEVEKLVNMARQKGWCLIPFGGGTNVSNATRCPAENVEKRQIISVDMKQMNRVLWVNQTDGLAHAEAGITGRHLVEELERRGFTMGHEPDSIEFSTLGGWIATKASGMKRSKYGNIEDIVKSCRVIGAEGLLWKGAENEKVIPGRVAEGLDVCSLLIGSEGCLGIITSAVIRVWPLPEAREYDSLILPSFRDGLQFVRAVARLGSNIPASVRLLDNAHFRLGQALRPDVSSILGQLKEMVIKAASSILGNFDRMSVVCATISYEGSAREVHLQKKLIKELAGLHGGVLLGPNIGKSGYELTFMIAYLRDFAMTYHLLGESFETFVPWSKIESLVAGTKERIVKEHRSRLLPGTPFVGCRVTQLYHEGACLYFYLCISFEGVDNASAVFSELEEAARDEILQQGGSLSHHHGIGKLRAPLLKGRASVGFDKTLASVKKGIDKDNIFGARNGPFAFCSEKNL